MRGTGNAVLPAAAGEAQRRLLELAEGEASGRSAHGSGTSRDRGITRMDAAAGI
jgi:hypothetical protein